jgi:(p)ppGpp synthase/HD superfamily hydrolase
VLSERFEQALSYAARLHREQIRKGSGVAYITHLLAVTSIALEHGASEDEAIAALLHDAIEDQGGAHTREEIRGLFGDTVCTIVQGCTETELHPKPPWRERKEHYLERLSVAAPSIRLVSAADKLHNARSLVQDYRQQGEGLWQRFSGRKDGTLWFYQALVTEYQARGPKDIAAELDRVVSTLLELSRQTAEHRSDPRPA